VEGWGEGEGVGGGYVHWPTQVSKITKTLGRLNGGFMPLIAQPGTNPV